MAAPQERAREPYIPALKRRGFMARPVNRDELDIASLEGAKFKPQNPGTNRELLDAFDKNLAKARTALQAT